MSKRVQGHPGVERLLRLADGELTPRQSAAVRDHLEACWDCRAEMESIQGAVGDCVHYRKSVLQPHLPPPPMPWRDLSAGFRALDREIAAESSWWRVTWEAVSRPGFWVPVVAAGLLVTLVLAPWLRVTPTVQAAELLRRAVEAAESRPASAKSLRKMQIRTKSKKLVYSPAAAAADVRPVAALFESARYDWADPLSAKAYLDWHGRLGQKTDEVIPDGDEFYRVRTRSSEGELSEATLRLRQDDLRPVQGMFKFRGDEWVELTELAPEPTLALVAAAPVAVAAPIAAVPPPGAPAEPAAATMADELRVMEALHRMGADLGDPIEITRTGARVEVKAFGIGGRRRAQIEQTLQAVPVANLRFVDEAIPASLAVANAAGGALAVKPAGSPIQSYLEERLGGPAGIEQFGNEVFDKFESIMARAHAIERLSTRFSASAASLGPGELATYRAMQRDHAAALLRLEQDLAATLGPVIPAAPAALGPGPADGRSILEAARRLDRSISIMLGAAPLAGNAAALPARIAGEQAALANLTRSFLESMGQ